MPPRSIIEVLPAGVWSENPIDRVVLDYDGRHRRRIILAGDSGAQYLLNLPHAVHLRDGDGLRLANGGVIKVAARVEPLLEVRAATLKDLLIIAWHLGNRHLPASIQTERILIRRDHVIAHMLEHQGALIREVDDVFDPESGAYHDHDH